MQAKGPGDDVYHAYLLRLWRDAPEAPWRASLEPVSNGELVAFSSVRDLFHYLGNQMEEVIADERTADPLDEDCP